MTFVEEIQRLKAIRKEHPYKIVMSGKGVKQYECCLMKFGEEWYHIGLGDQAAEWQWRRMLNE